MNLKLNSKKYWHGILAVGAMYLTACADVAELNVEQGMGPTPTLPPPSNDLIPQVNIAEAVGWPDDRKPKPARGLAVVAFARDLDHPRWLYVLPNGDVLVAETNAPKRPEGSDGIKDWVMNIVKKDAGAATPSADRITLLRDNDGDGIADQRSLFVKDLHSPFGMALVKDRFYVANTDAVVEFAYQEGDLRIDHPGRTLAPLPGGALNHHWTKSLIASADGQRLYVGVGSNSNIAENGMDKEEGRAAILEIQRQTGKTRIYANGLRNPVGMTWVEPTGELWVSVNERDEIGGDLVPDYMTSVKSGGFYGWPYSYFGAYVDERVEPQRPDLVREAIAPDYALGPHTASLGLLYVGNSRLLPGEFSNGIFVSQHGSWNRKPKSGYKVIFIDFVNGKPAEMPRDALTEFLSNDEEKAYGRPVGLALASDGALLVADDVGNAIWRITSALNMKKLPGRTTSGK